jgi:hypothetical protein
MVLMNLNLVLKEHLITMKSKIVKMTASHALLEQLVMLLE